MRIAIVGCGLNSDYHVRFVREYPGAEIVALVDRDPARARACAEKNNIPTVYASVAELGQTGPDVVHIITPPQTHAAVAREALGLRCHVLIEKPLAMNQGEAEELYDLAARQNVRLCTMHNHWFDPCMIAARTAVEQSAAGRIMNVESYYGLNTNIPAFRRYPAPNVLPWLYTLPGGVYHDFLAHPLYVMLPFTGRPKEITVLKKSHGTLPWNMPDELKILVNGERAFGTVTVSFAARPHLHLLRLYGEKMALEVDFNTMTTVTHGMNRLPKAAQRAMFTLAESAQLFTQTTANVANFLAGKLRPYQGMKTLIHRFYDSIRDDTEPPVSREDALAVIRTMDEVWKQLQVRPPRFAPVPSAGPPPTQPKKVLVTGGTGFLGKAVVAGLRQAGYSVRAVARKLSNIEPLKAMGAEIFFGDVADRQSLDDAFRGMDIVIHAAAGTSGTKSDCELGTLQGTRNVLELCERNRVSKLVYISSCSVYGIAECRKNQVVNESAPLERYPFRRGDYSASKQQAEDMVRWAMERKAFPVVVLRPGTIYGPGGDHFSPMIGLSFFDKAFVVFGLGSFVLPFVYRDNLVDAIIKSAASDKANNQIFNVVDDHGITKRQYMTQLIKKLHPRAPVVYCPLGLLYAATAGQELLCKLLKRAPFLTRYRLLSSQRSVQYDSSKITETLHWKPRVGFEEAAAAIIRSERSGRGELAAAPEATEPAEATATGTLSKSA